MSFDVARRFGSSGDKKKCNNSLGFRRSGPFHGTPNKQSNGNKSPEINEDDGDHGDEVEVVRDNSVPWMDPKTGKYFTPEDFLHASEAAHRPIPCFADRWRDNADAISKLTAQALVTQRGTITLRLRDQIQVDMTVDQALRVVNKKNNTVLALSESGASSALMHPNGRVYQYGSRVEIIAHDLREGNHKFAKMWFKGVCFTSEECALIYLVDSAGTRTTTDTFTDMTQDFSIPVFYGSSRYGVHCIPEAIQILENSQYTMSDDGAEHWVINGVRITQADDGLLRISKASNKYSIRTSPQNGTASLSTPFIHTTASLGSTSHLFVRRGERRMHYDGASFIVRNAGHSAGFDEKNQLKVY